jgi:hypothetical protein
MGKGSTGFWRADNPKNSDRDDPEETPDTPPDEPRPPRVQEPPPQPESKGPYVVRAY